MGVKGHAGVSQGQPEVKFLTNVLWPPNLVERTPDQSVMHWWGQRSCSDQLGSTRGNIAYKCPRVNVMWLLGVIRGQPEGNCLEMHRVIKCSQCYRALCCCRCSSCKLILSIFFTNVYYKCSYHVLKLRCSYSNGNPWQTSTTMEFLACFELFLPFHLREYCTSN